MRIIGVDPGTASTGIGLIEGSKQKGFSYLYHTCISTKANTKIEDRVKIIYLELARLLKHYKPDLVSVELLFFNTNPKTAMSVGRASGVIILCASMADIRVVEFTPLQVKVAVTGYGRAEKSEVQKMVTKLLKLDEPPRPDDAADALAIALCAGVSI